MFELVLLFAVELLVVPVLIAITFACLMALASLGEVVIGALRKRIGVVIGVVTGERGVLDVERLWPNCSRSSLDLTRIAIFAAILSRVGSSLRIT